MLVLEEVREDRRKGGGGGVFFNFTFTHNHD